MQRLFPTGCYACEAGVERAAMGTKLRSRGLAPRGTEFLLLDDFELARELPPLLGELEIGRTKLRRDGLLSHGLALGGLCEALLCVAVHDEPTRKTAWPFRNGARQLAGMPGRSRSLLPSRRASSASKPQDCRPPCDGRRHIPSTYADRCRKARFRSAAHGGRTPRCPL